jgi:hypothetical protein
MTDSLRAAFIDRDGVPNVDHGCVHRIDDFEWLPGAVLALQQLQEAGRCGPVLEDRFGRVGHRLWCVRPRPQPRSGFDGPPRGPGMLTPAAGGTAAACIPSPTPRSS